MIVIFVLLSVDCNLVEERLEKFTKFMEAAKIGGLAIPDLELRDSHQMGKPK
jgi:tryptophan synthase alpha subunit